MSEAARMAFRTVEALLTPDIVGGGRWLVNARSSNVAFWDIANIHEIDAKQRLQTSATGFNRSYGGGNDTSALPSGAELRRSSALALLRRRVRAWL
jgi:hypothetical protein